MPVYYSGRAINTNEQFDSHIDNIVLTNLHQIQHPDRISPLSNWFQSIFVKLRLLVMEVIGFLKGVLSPLPRKQSRLGLFLIHPIVALGVAKRRITGGLSVR